MTPHIQPFIDAIPALISFGVIALALYIVTNDEDQIP
jgi:hypothetical protein